MDLTPHEIRILEEVAGLRPASPWGAWVGACLEFLQESGYLTKVNALTQKGKAFIQKEHPGWEAGQ